MKLFSYTIAILISFLLIPIVTFGAEIGNTQVENSKVEHLVQVCKLWNQIKYFHPYLAYHNDIDWDAALIKAIPKVNNANNTTEFRIALQSMLDVLGDPATKIVKKIPPTSLEKSSDELQPAFKFTEDNILIVSINRYSDLDDFAGTLKRMAKVSQQVLKAKGVIFDLRSTAPMNYDQRESFRYAIQSSQLAEKLTSIPLSTPGQRSRMHIGFKPQYGLQVTGFYSAFSTEDGRVIMPLQEAKDFPIVFVVNNNSDIPIEALALQEAQKCIILAEGDINDSSIVHTERIELNDEFEIQIRLGELVYKDGRTGIQPNIQVSGDPNESFPTALRLVREFKPTPVTRKEIPIFAAPLSDKPYFEISYPQLEYRLLAAFRIWGVINYFSPYKNLFDKDWDSVHKEFIPKMEQAGNAREYNLLIVEMLTHIHDAHAYVYSSVLEEYFGTMLPPINVRFVEGLPVISSIQDVKEAKNFHLEIGDIILKVDGENVQDRIERLKKYQSASTPQVLMRRVADDLLLGPDNSTVVLTIRDRANQVREVKIPRNRRYYQNIYQRSGDILKILPGNIGYVDLDRLTFEMVDNMFEKLKDTEAIIFDLRSIPQFTVFSIAPRLTDKKHLPFAIFRRLVVTAISNSSDLYSSNLTYSYLDKVNITDSRKYKGRTVMLIDDRAQSQAETTGLVFRAANDTKFIGSATAGTDGEVTNFFVPGGILIFFTGQELRHPDGKQLQRIGLLPDIEVKPTLKGMRERRDEVLEVAIEYLTKELKTAKNKE
jgi:C-terminal processing protease CtpA/Prc